MKKIFFAAISFAFAITFYANAQEHKHSNAHSHESKITKPTDILIQEHKVVSLVLEGAADEANKIKNGDKPNFSRIEKIVDFSRNFTDVCHHAKEERILFPKMGEHGFSVEAEPVSAVLKQHADGRQFVANIEKYNKELKEGKESAKQNLVDNLLGYVTMLRSHIDNENNNIFKAAQNTFNAHDNHIMIEAFDKVEKEETGAGVHEKYDAMAHEIYENK